MKTRKKQKGTTIVLVIIVITIILLVMNKNMKETKISGETIKQEEACSTQDYPCTKGPATGTGFGGNLDEAAQDAKQNCITSQSDFAAQCKRELEAESKECSPWPKCYWWVQQPSGNDPELCKPVKCTSSLEVDNDKNKHEYCVYQGITKVDGTYTNGQPSCTVEDGPPPSSDKQFKCNAEDSTFIQHGWCKSLHDE